MGWILFAIFLYLACAALLIAEVFVPSGGVISICAFACLFGGIYIFYKHGTGTCIAGVIVAIIMIPTVLVVAYKIFPRTKFGKGIILARPQREQGDAVPDSGKLKELLGATGVVLTPLRPVGMCDFSGRRVECVAESGYVDKDTRVRVIGVESTQVTVREVEKS
jgi:membrane-bound serine protease (ClpP class)